MRKTIEAVIDSKTDTSELVLMAYEPYWMRLWLRKKFYSDGHPYYILDVEHNDINDYGSDFETVFSTNFPRDKETLIKKIEGVVDEFMKHPDTFCERFKDGVKWINEARLKQFTVKLPNGEDKIIDIPEGCYDYEDPYSIIGNYIDEHVHKDFPEDIPSERDCLVVMSHGNGVEDGYFYDLYSFENGVHVWEHDWWEGEDYVELVGYAPLEELADKIVEMWKDKKEG